MFVSLRRNNGYDALLSGLDIIADYWVVDDRCPFRF